MLRRDLSFAYRAPIWEDNPQSATGGHIDIGYELLHAAFAALLMRRIAIPAPPELRFTFYLDLEGVRGRGLVDATQPRGPGEPARTWAEDEARASLSVSAKDVEDKPLGIAIRLAIELAAQLGDGFATEQAMRQVLKNRKHEPTRDFVSLGKLVKF
jgi:hypothetical protein